MADYYLYMIFYINECHLWRNETLSSFFYKKNVSRHKGNIKTLFFKHSIDIIFNIVINKFSRNESIQIKIMEPFMLSEYGRETVNIPRGVNVSARTPPQRIIEELSKWTTRQARFLFCLSPKHIWIKMLLAQLFRKIRK